MPKVARSKPTVSKRANTCFSLKRRRRATPRAPTYIKRKQMSSPFNNWQVSGQYPSTIGGTGIGRKFFPAPSNQIGVVGVAPSATSSAGQLNIEGRNILNGYPFAIKAAGNFEVGSGGACPNVLIEVVANTAGLGATPSFT